MNKDQTLALFAQGQEAWNAWAEQMLAERQAYEETGAWNASEPETAWVHHWISEARADFTGHRFTEVASFSGFFFPGEADFRPTEGKGETGSDIMVPTCFEASSLFESARFCGNALFDEATFSRNANFSEATFSKLASFKAATFSRDTKFGEATFSGSAQFNAATFSGLAQFGKAMFSREAEFDAAMFSGNTGFDEAMFSQDAWFREVTFSRDAEFQKARFLRRAWFSEATFSGKAWFDKARFSALAQFNKAAFSRDASFNAVMFLGDAEFNAVTFSGRSLFDAVTFSGLALFDKATFSGDAAFDAATFSSPAQFYLARFGGHSTFENACFEKVASFVAMKGESFFSLRGVTFHKTPDFEQAHFAEAPMFDASRFPGKPAPGETVRWRALKRLAVQGHDHEREQLFFAQEIKSLRGGTDWMLPRLQNLFRSEPVWQGGARYWLGLFYQWSSDFGRSIALPVVWWGLLTTAFAFVYLDQHFPFKDPPYASRLMVWQATDYAPPLECVKGKASAPLASASYLAVNKGLVAGFGGSDKLASAYYCLYGEEDDLPSPQPRIPDNVAFAGMFQALLSAPLIFLFLLAVRNHFRIK